MALKIAGGGLNVFRKKRPPPVAMELEFLDAFRQRAEMAEQPVLFGPRSVEAVEPAGDEQAVPHQPDDNKSAHAEQDLPGTPAKIRGTRQQPATRTGAPRHDQPGQGSE